MVRPQPRPLGSLGISELDEGVYRALLVRPGRSVADLVDLAPRRADLTASLRRLEELGFVRAVGTRPRRYAPVTPESAIESLVHQRQQELLGALAMTAELTAEYRVGRHDDPGALVEILTGATAVAQRFEELQSSCTSELLLFDRPPYAAPPDNPQQQSVLARDVTSRTVYAPESLLREDATAYVRALVDAGEDARVLPGLPMKLAVFDRRVALIPLTLDSDIQQSAVIHRSTLLDAMVMLFEFFWERALPLAGVASPPGADLSADDRRLLSLLVSGAKDEAIARDLDVGVRTVRRRMQRLLQLLDAETRFQAGMQAARRGWV